MCHRTSRRLKAVVPVVILCLLGSAPVAWGQIPTPNQIWYASPVGSAAGAGTAVSPWDLATALQSASVRPGDAVYLLDGTYATAAGSTPLAVNLSGDANAPIVVRPAPGAHAILSGGLQFAPYGASANVWLVDLDICNATSTEGLGLYGAADCKVINCTVHDNSGDGIGDYTFLPGSRAGALRTEVYGCSIYNNILITRDANGKPIGLPRGNGLCGQNAAGLGNKLYDDNVFQAVTYPYCYTMGLSRHGEVASNILCSQNIAYNLGGGIPSWLMGSDVPADNLQMLGNYLYNISHVYFGNSSSPGAGNTHGQIRDNVVVNCNAINVCNWATWGVSNNLVAFFPYNGSDAFAVSQTTAQSGTIPAPPPPAGLKVVLRPNRYDPNRANLVIFNWDQKTNVQVALDAFLSYGQMYALYDPANLYGPPVISGTYDGTPVNVAMAGGLFRAYIVRKTGVMGNVTPTVSAGADQAIALPVNTITLNGTLSDDGLPVGAAVATAWTQVSGPATVTFADTGAAVTTATFLTDGTYVLQLSATDTQLSSSSQCTVFVRPAGITPLLHLPCNEGAGTIAHDTSGHGRDGTLGGGATWLTGGASAAVLEFDKVSGSVTVPNFPLGADFTVAFWFKPSGNAGGTYQYLFSWGVPGAVTDCVDAYLFEDGAGACHDMLQTVATGNYESGKGTTDVLDPNAYLDGRWHHYCLTSTHTQRSWVYLDGSLVADGNRGSYAINPAGNLVLGTRCDFFMSRYYGGAMANVYVFDYALAAPEIQALAAARPGNMTPTAHAGPGKTVLLADGVTLAGALSDDGLPDPPALTTATWSLVSGPGTVSFDNVHALNAHASFSAAGTYVLRLTASDSVLSASDDVQITVVANNLAPVVSAGPDKSIMLPASVTLVGTVSDEGLPNPPAATSCTWTCVSGPGPVTFANPNAAATTATFFTAGTYVVRLTATDSALSGWDDVTIIASGVYEFGPVVSIIAPSSITVPTRTVSLAGSVSDDGRPAPPPATCAWSVVSGPGPVSFSNPAAASTTASLRCAGTYVLRLTASDGLLTGHADATITLDGGGYLTSDFNGDGCVDGVDFLIWQSHYPAAAGATKATGDANGDGKVDGVDFLTWQVEYAIWQ